MAIKLISICLHFRLVFYTYRYLKPIATNKYKKIIININTDKVAITINNVCTQSPS